jgi:hypothetical protein
MKSVLDIEKQDYITVPDTKIERYVSICHGKYLFDFKHASGEIMFRSRRKYVNEKGNMVAVGSSVIDVQDLQKIVAIMQALIDGELGEVASGPKSDSQSTTSSRLRSEARTGESQG